MATMKIGTSPRSRTEAGAAVLAAARTVDTRPIRARLTRFERAQRAYVEAQRKVDAAEAELQALQTRISRLDLEQDERVDALARALVSDGRSRLNPFATFGVPAPKALMKLPVADEAKAVHTLAAMVQRTNGAGKATLQATQTLDKAASAVEQALASLEKLQAAVRETRHMREAIAQSWTSALAALKSDARSATDEGAPLLYSTLFDRPGRPARNHKPAPPPAAPALTPQPSTAATTA